MDRVLLKQVNAIWDVYDRDGNGVLDLGEMRLFIKDMVQSVMNTEEVTDGKIEEVF